MPFTRASSARGGGVGYSQKATLAWGGHTIKHVTGPAVRPNQGTDVVAGGPTKNRCGQQNVQVQIAAVGVLNAEQAIVQTVDMKACLTRVRGKCCLGSMSARHQPPVQGQTGAEQQSSGGDQGPAAQPSRCLPMIQFIELSSFPKHLRPAPAPAQPDPHR